MTHDHNFDEDSFDWGGNNNTKRYSSSKSKIKSNKRNNGRKNESNSVESCSYTSSDDDDDVDEQVELDLQRQRRNNVLCSVLNTVVNYVLVPPDPLFEPEEYYEQQRQQQQKKQLGVVKREEQILVPVMRIFGPIVRRDSSMNASSASPKSTHKPVPLLQSACLYVHNAYPYIIARPIICGPDGSSKLNVQNNRRRSHCSPRHIDWDNATEVRRILPILTTAVEVAIQRSIQETSFFSKNSNKNSNNSRNSRNRTNTTALASGPGVGADPATESATTTPPRRRMIRNVSVVVGRGFYTYCPGPVAPFLKLEYYDPSDRWRVKRCMERGLSFVSMEDNDVNGNNNVLERFYYPDPEQYNYNKTSSLSKSTALSASIASANANGIEANKDNASDTDDLAASDDDNSDNDMDHDHRYNTGDNNDKLQDDTLKFNCYEAHTPYTMQFFKDYNLAGMSYIHIASDKANENSQFNKKNTLNQMMKKRRTLNYTSSNATGRYLYHDNRTTNELELNMQTNNKGDSKVVDESKETRRKTSSLAQFRHPLPIGPRRHPFMNHFEKKSITDHDGRNYSEGANLFLLENTPEKYVSWEDTGKEYEMEDILSAIEDDDDNVAKEGNSRLDTESSNMVDKSQPTVKRLKQTSCDVELDVSVEHILNVLDVMTELPDDIGTQQKQQIHWRAVPSLREIWIQERHRMSQLLPLEHNMFSQMEQDTKPDTPSFTLNVKTVDTDIPGADLATKGMQRLIRITPGLDDNFRRALKDIVQRHTSVIREIDRRCNTAIEQHQLRRISKRIKINESRSGIVPAPKCNKFSSSIESTPSNLDVRHCNDDAFEPNQPCNGIILGSSPEILTPSHDEALEALGALGSVFDCCESGDDNVCSADDCTGSERLRNGSEAESCHVAEIGNRMDELSNDKVSLYEQDIKDTYCDAAFNAMSQSMSLTQSQSRRSRRSSSERFQALSQLYYPSSSPNDSENKRTDTLDILDKIPSQQIVALTDHEEFELSQRIERGDGIVKNGPFEHIDDVIDPMTLVPYEIIDEGDEDQSQSSEDDDDDEDLVDKNIPEDGINFESKLERTLSVLATQTFRETSVDDDGENVEVRNSYEDKTLPHSNDYAELHDDDGSDSLYSIDVRGLSQSCKVHRSLQQESDCKDQYTCTSQNFPFASTCLPEICDGSQIIMTETPWIHSACRQIEPVVNPPTRSSMKASSIVKTLHPLPSTDEQRIPWMKFLTANENTRRSSRIYDWFPNVCDVGGTEAYQVRPPPSRKSVTSWYKKHKGSKQQPANQKSKHRSSNATVEPESVPGKEIAGMIRNLAAFSDNGSKLRNIHLEQNINVATEAAELNFDKRYILDGAGLELLLDNRGVKIDEAKLSYKNADPSKELISEDSVRSINFTESKVLSKADTTPSSFGIQDGTPITPCTEALQGIGNQGGRIWVERGGQLKAKTRQSQSKLEPTTQSECMILDNLYLPTPVTVMQVEVHVQCRSGRACASDLQMIAMTPDSDRDKLHSIVYVFARDPGGGEPLEYLESYCLFVPVERDIAENVCDGRNISRYEYCAADLKKSMPRSVLGVSAPLMLECVRDERQLLLRFASLVRQRDPDMLLSWDTQGAGLGYIIERGAALGNSCGGDSDSRLKEIDMARLLGRTPTTKVESSSLAQALNADDASDVVLSEMAKTKSDLDKSKDSTKKDNSQWKGSGLGSDWDERVGAGAAAASVCGRLVFAAWKLVAEEVKHPNFSYLPAVVSTVLNKRIPFHDNLRLSQWYACNNGRERWRVLHHRLKQATVCLQLFDVLDIIGRSGEAARLSGVEFSQSFPGIRGSQYKVEGVLLRALQSLNSNERGSKKGIQNRKLTMSTARSSCASLTFDLKSQVDSPWKTIRHAVGEDTLASQSTPLHSLSDRCYFFFSPSLQDANVQEALEVQALTLEPESGHRQDPVVVCDFTALYPSLVIAYNLCYSTCAGKLDYHSTRSEMLQEGRTTGKIGPLQYAEGRTAIVIHHHMPSILDGSIQKNDRAYVSPTGTMYVSEAVLKGVLPQVLDEMLCTRAMLKKAAKQYKKHVPNLSPAILRQLEARQLALKYVANVTYGYTSATFSGRCAMPLLADTIVECARRTLTNAINLANGWGMDPKNRWNGAKVIYGDTDSVFVQLPGRSVHEAFQFGEEFCSAVTASNPPPVQLKLEKVYLGSMMQTKKKYCGMKYESKEQKKPDFEAKGIETVRRDQCELTQRILRESLITLYRSGIDAVKSYLFRQWSLILAGIVPVSEYILTGRVRSRYRGGRIGPVQAVLARRLAEADPGRVVRHKERQPYIIVATPGIAFRLKDCVMTPLELLEQWDTYSIHSGYYISRHVNAALQRCLSLPPYNVDVTSWFEECPKPRGRIHFWPVTRLKANSTVMISTYFGSERCSLCGNKCASHSRSRAAVCTNCSSHHVLAVDSALRRLNLIQHEAASLATRCSGCNQCFEDASTFAPVITQRSSGASSKFGTKAAISTSIAIPIANCTCIDCPILFERHSVREKELEALALCQALDLHTR